jgi:hypothetical protein
MTGYLLPMDDEIATGLTRVGFPDAAAFDQIKALMNDVFGGALEGEILAERATWRDPAYPHLNSEGDFRAPWQYPTSAPELPSDPAALDEGGGDRIHNHLITAGPHQRGADARALFDVVIGSPSLRDAFESAQTPGEADGVGERVTPKDHLGDAVSFSQYLCWLATRDREEGTAIVDWNLDADRGYGYHCWDWNRDHEHTLRDPENNPYPAPCQPPSQAAGFDPSKPVLLHFEESGSPACGSDDALTVMLGKPDAPPMPHAAKAAPHAPKGGK